MSIRIARPSGTGALKQRGFIGQGFPVDGADKIQVVTSLEPLELHEYFPYGYIPFAVNIFSPAVAARNSGANFGAGGVTSDQAGTLIVVETVRNLAGSVLSIRWGANQAWANNVVSGVIARDNRVSRSPSAAEIYPGLVSSGDLAAVPGGEVIGTCNGSGATGQADTENIGIVLNSPLRASDDSLILVNFTVNVALNATLRGYIALPR